jgi:hypothetical protein
MQNDQAFEQALAALTPILRKYMAPPPPVVMAAPDELIAVRPRAVIAGVPASGVRQLIKAGVITSAKIGASTYVRRSDVLSVLEKLRPVAAPAPDAPDAELDPVDVAIEKANARRRLKALRAGAT